MKKDKDIIVERKSTRESLQQIKTYLEQNDLRVPKEFDEKIIEAAKKFNGGRLPPIPAIANLLKCCQYWKRYCTSEGEFVKLVCEECYSMARIQCSVISTHFDTTSFIGNSCKVKEENLPECTTTVASYARSVLYEGMGASEKVFTPPL